MTRTALVLGAAGRLGQCLTEAFTQAGWTVRAQARKPLPQALAQDPLVQAVRCDALDAAATAAAARGCDVIVHALNPLYTEWDRLALPLADAAMRLARSSGALLMLPGNVYNFGKELPSRLRTDTPERGDTPKARLRIAMEAQMRDAPDIDSVVIRAGDFFGGPGSGTWFDMAIATQLARGRCVYPGNPTLPHAWAYLPDLAQVFVRMAQRRDELRGHHRVHFPGHTLTGAQIQAAIEAHMGMPLRSAHLPWGVIRLLAPFKPMWAELVVMRYLWERAHQLEDPALAQWIGAVPCTPLAEAVRATLPSWAGAARPSVPIRV